MAILAGTSVPSPGPARAVVATAGACVLTIELTGTVPLVPGAVTWSLGGGGTCAVDDNDDFTAPATVSGSLSGFLDQHTVGCMAAVLDGVVTLNVTTSGYGSMTGLATAAVSTGVVAPLVTVTVATFAAAGTFVQDPFDTKRCVRDLGATGVTWTGVLAFEDPMV